MGTQWHIKTKWKGCTAMTGKVYKYPSSDNSSFMHHKRCIHAFSFIEIVISVSIISIISITVGLAMQGSFKRSGSIRCEISNNQNHNLIFQRMSDDIKFATTISSITSTSISLIRPDINNPDIFIKIEYSWISNSNTLSRTKNTDEPVNLANTISSFDITSELMTNGPTNTIAGINISFKSNNNQDKSYSRYIETINNPISPN